MTPEALLAAAGRRVRLVRVGRALMAAAPFVACALVVGLAIAWWVPWGWLPLAVWVGAATTLFWVAFSAWHAALDPASVAAIADAHLDSHDALGAYLQFAGAGSLGSLGADSPFLEPIRLRAERTAEGSNAATAVPTSL
ncbi:MAG TPA: hypothetical protein PLP95_02340, partial [Microthrixaceae bacterium]|nr:hypothetical protein [Microthrixaceae bacterium]